MAAKIPLRASVPRANLALASKLGLREWLKLAVWLLTSALTLLFSYKVAAVAAVVWVMGLATTCGGFLAFFCFQKTT